MPMRYMVENVGADKENFGLALGEAKKISRNQNVKNITLLVISKKGFEKTAPGEFLGATISENLAKGETVSIGNHNLSLVIKNNFRPTIKDQIVIGVYTTGKELRLLDDTKNAKAVIFLPLSKAEGIKWLTRWSPTIIGQRTWTTRPNTLSASALNMLNILTQTINLSSEQFHPNDKKAAKKALSDLKKLGEAPKPEDIYDWALKNGWNSENASGLEQLAQKKFK